MSFLSISQLPTFETTGFFFFVCVCVFFFLLFYSQVRNVASWAGGLVLAHNHPDFPSDLRTILAAADARLTLEGADGPPEQVSIDGFQTNGLKNGQIIRSVTIPTGSANVKVGLYSVGARKARHGVVNAGFRVELDDDKKVKSASLTYGGVQPGLFRPSAAEDGLGGKPLISQTLKQALHVKKFFVTVEFTSLSFMCATVCACVYVCVRTCGADVIV